MAIYESSVIRHGGCKLWIAKESGGKALYVSGEGEAYDLLNGELSAGGKRCALTNANAEIIRRLFPFTRPVSREGHDFTVGLGDRLGLASPGHIRLVKDMLAKGIKIFPVLAQQSMRELNLTGRTYDDVLAAAVWAVFQEGYKGGYGADGDHLKTHGEVQTALDAGFSMITLDCSEHIKSDAAGLGDPAAIYAGAVGHIIDIYNNLLKGRGVDVEVSVDETAFSTSPEAHYYIAGELVKAGVEFVSLAPRFCGEFQKGIDYRGEVGEFTREFKAHAEIARELGYKLSVHSGSDKFKVFPAIYKQTGRAVHLKTAGTSWLEALRVIARKRAELFREIYKFAVGNAREAQKYYVISADTANMPDIGGMGGGELEQLLEQDDARQVLHITYGLILTAENNGAPVYKDKLYAALHECEDDYYNALIKHLGRHIEV